MFELLWKALYTSIRCKEIYIYIYTCAHIYLCCELQHQLNHLQKLSEGNRWLECAEILHKRHILWSNFEELCKRWAILCLFPQSNTSLFPPVRTNQTLSALSAVAKMGVRRSWRNSGFYSITKEPRGCCPLYCIYTKFTIKGYLSAQFQCKQVCLIKKSFHRLSCCYSAHCFIYTCMYALFFCIY